MLFRSPVRILHGRKDMQVPVAAALEHRRIIPQAELTIWEDQSHFAVFVEPERVAATVDAFLLDVEAGRARTAADATPEELRLAAEPFHPSPPTGLGAAVAAGLLGIATLGSEDLATASGGLLVGAGKVGWGTAVVGLVLGIFGGDLGLQIGRAHV